MVGCKYKHIERGGGKKQKRDKPRKKARGKGEKETPLHESM